MTIDGSMKVGEVRVAKAEDFEQFKRLAESTEKWSLLYDKHGIKVFSKFTEGTSVKMMKVVTQFSDVPSMVLYDVLHDPEYRRHWDENMIESYELCKLDGNNDIGYYSVKCPAPMKNRDFVTQRSWCCKPEEFLIINHTVHHKAAQLKKGFVRGDSILTGYYVKARTNGCSLTYVAQVDPKGILPKWVVNRVSSKIAPKVIHKLHKATMGYKEWKENHSPEYKPWLKPEQSTLPVIKKEDLEYTELVFESEQEQDTMQEQEDIGNDTETYSSEDNLDDIL
ncbi:START domain-containing protein 10-like [Actinia tenebrosa]|uniref:START domain-containing protein 10 n=1 Tax=Actinia tenebrosa TaxID=6105 RepID=A0A6P8H649_ACTTE|nr:START domain-containing protein 10-like [Actinia tenebrosa]